MGSNTRATCLFWLTICVSSADLLPTSLHDICSADPSRPSHLSPPPQSSLCTCGTVLDMFRDHLLGCSQKTNLIIKRHDALCGVIFNTLLVGNSRCRREQHCSSDSGKRPGEIFHLNFQYGLQAYCDVTVRISLQPSYLLQAACYAGAAAKAWEDEKVLRHQMMVSATASIFKPLVVESLGL